MLFIINKIYNDEVYIIGAKDQRWIQTAIKLAKRIEIDNSKHASILVRGGKVINIGTNKDTKKGILGDLSYEAWCGWHSELDCLHRLPERLIRGSTLYVGGWNKNGHPLYSRPCKYCQRFLAKFELKRVVYSMSDGTYEEMVL